MKCHWFYWFLVQTTKLNCIPLSFCSISKLLINYLFQHRVQISIIRNKIRKKYFKLLFSSEWHRKLKHPVSLCGHTLNMKPTRLCGFKTEILNSYGIIRSNIRNFVSALS